MRKAVLVFSLFAVSHLLAPRGSAIAQTNFNLCESTYDSALKYAEHVKDEAIASLTYNDSVLVLKMAADEARSAARSELRKLIPNYPTYRSGEIVGWCRGYAIQFVRAFIQQHDENHEILVKALEYAKRQLRGLDR